MSRAAFGGYEDISNVNLALRKPIMEQKKQELYLSTSKTKWKKMLYVVRSVWSTSKRKSNLSKKQFRCRLSPVDQFSSLSVSGSCHLLCHPQSIS